MSVTSSQLDKKQLARLAAEQDLEVFIRLVHPHRILGSVHKEIIQWWTRQDSLSHQLLLMPRDHMKSALVGYRVAWEVTRDPTLRVLYVSSTAGLAIKQLKFIKDILTSPIYTRYWPNMVNPDVGHREKWTETEIAVDDPRRKAESVRDATIFTGGLTTSLTGFHCDIAVLDDVVVIENAYTQDGREKVKTQYSLLSSIESSEAKEWAVGTRYHPKDLYADLLETEVDTYDEQGELSGSTPLYEVFERKVEDVGDGTGEFLWPRQQRVDGKWFGFNAAILAKKRAQYKDKTQFRAQYYNDPNDISGASINPDFFQYYDRTHLSRSDGSWFIKGRRLNVFAAVDFAFSLSKKADYTAIVVLGIDANRNTYVLDISRFKTDRISEYFDQILRLHQKWDFRKIRAEITSAQSIIVRDLKENYIKPHGLALSIEEHKPTRYAGTKEERMEAILQPRYSNRQIWHYHGGNCQILEEELVLQNPSHDDVKDCLASCIEICIAPSQFGSSSSARQSAKLNVLTHPRFGGIG